LVRVRCQEPLESLIAESYFDGLSRRVGVDATSATVAVSDMSTSFRATVSGGAEQAAVATRSTATANRRMGVRSSERTWLDDPRATQVPQRYLLDDDTRTVASALATPGVLY
jgi:hypothetical protein